MPAIRATTEGVADEVQERLDVIEVRDGRARGDREQGDDAAREPGGRGGGHATVSAIP
ncbi:MAG TPA: hypothetical protein VKB54_16285 [Solirubrobacteraceae bacterium]|nr:hypothetical protein [Solirubrobacteraceae bacterium]